MILIFETEQHRFFYLAVLVNLSQPNDLLLVGVHPKCQILPHPEKLYLLHLQLLNTGFQLLAKLRFLLGDGLTLYGELSNDLHFDIELLFQLSVSFGDQICSFFVVEAIRALTRVASIDDGLRRAYCIIFCLVGRLQ